MLAVLLQGIALGFSGSVAPGPFHAYLLSQSLRHGWRHTLPAAFSPLISDVFIVSLVLLVLTRTPPWFLNAIRVAGGLFLLYLAWGAYRNFRDPETSLQKETHAGKQRLLEAVVMNLLNPNPWIYWTAVAGPSFLAGWRRDPSHGVAFLVGFYVTLVSMFALLVVLFDKARQLGAQVSRVGSGISALALAVLGIYQLVLGLSNAVA